MNKLMVEIYLPAADLAGGYYIPGQNSILCERTTGIELDVNLTPCEMGIINGARLMLI